MQLTLDRLGSLLTGIGAIIIGVGSLLIGVSLYKTSQGNPSIYAKCIGLGKSYIITISNPSAQDFYGAKIINTYNNKTICTLPDLPSISDQYCKVRYSGVYLVKTIKPFAQKVVICK